eukprot:CAMPEP_0180205094 /NCGR_PEP_ID=MMETSP0987-20121128/8793_1 /TAXON_ID=697907 /ORGANISM="non described non described, Strain CCMP2293" /LENGTH=139 /DNA_ID=CAMNT_0022160691 /DNA_START=315 /DNA_END=734 /DNA_ORIENTATION=-
MMVRLGRRGGDEVGVGERVCWCQRVRASHLEESRGSVSGRVCRGPSPGRDKCGSPGTRDQGPPSRKSPGSDPVPSRCVQMFADIRNFTQLACPDASAAYVGGFTVDYHALDGTASLNNDGNYDNAAYDTYTINTCSGAH